MAKKELVIDVSAKSTKNKEPKLKAVPKFDYASIYTDSLDVIARRQGVEASDLDVGDPMSTGMLTTDLQMGGGIRAGMYTSAGGEQSTKTTNVLVWMAAAIKAGIPRIEFFDYEGCVTRETELSVSNKQVKLEDLFDLKGIKYVKPSSWLDQYAYVDTVDTRSSTGVSLRKAQLYYKGGCAITEVVLESGHKLSASNHPFFVRLTDGSIVQKSSSDLLAGDEVLIKKQMT